MTDMINAFTVTLERDLREDDAEALKQAIGQLRGVVSVMPNVAHIEDHIAYDRARADLRRRLWAALEVTP